MDKFSFKNYPPRVLVFLVCLIVTIKYGLHKLGNTFFHRENYGVITDLIYIFISAGTVLTILRWVNSKFMWRWLLRLLGLSDIRGTYQGYILSSFREDNDPSKSNIKRFCKIMISQTINGFYVKGDYFSDEEMKQHTSGFSSDHEELRKQPDGTCLVSYFYDNIGDKFHAGHQKYGLTNHTGICVLTYLPKERELQGYYFNRDRESNGKIFLKRIN